MIKFTSQPEHNNNNIQQALNDLEEKKEPFVILFQNDEGALQMATNGMTKDHAIETMEIAIAGLKGGEGDPLKE